MNTEWNLNRWHCLTALAIALIAALLALAAR